MISKQLFILCMCSLFVMTSCTGYSTTKQSTLAEKKRMTRFSMPQIPTTLTSAEQKAEFVVTHYWDNYDFADTTLISNADITEQGFADFVNILPNVSEQIMERGVDTLMQRASVDSAMYAHFVEMSEKYLYDPNSPYRNNDAYIVVLRHIVANPKLDEINKIRPRYQLESSLKNRVGDKAIDFTYTTEKGRKAKLYNVAGDPLLLFFFSPNCPTCKEVKTRLTENGVDKRVKILYVSPDIDSQLDTIYDLRASPTLYLLDKDKKVLLKDATIGQIEDYLNNIMMK